MFALNVWLTVKEERDVDEVARLLAEASRLSRREPGNLRFEVYHSETDPRRFLLCEHWSSREAWETHREAQAFREIYQPRVLPLVDREPHPSKLVE